MIKDVDERGDLKDWCGFAKNKCEWRRMIMKRIRVEKGEFGDGEDETTDDAECEHVNNTNNSTARRQTSNCDSRFRHKMSLNRRIIEPTNLSRR